MACCIPPRRKSLPADAEQSYKNRWLVKRRPVPGRASGHRRAGQLFDLGIGRLSDALFCPCAIIRCRRDFFFSPRLSRARFCARRPVHVRQMGNGQRPTCAGVSIKRRRRGASRIGRRRRRDGQRKMLFHDRIRNALPWPGSAALSFLFTGIDCLFFSRARVVCILMGFNARQSVMVTYPRNLLRS